MNLHNFSIFSGLNWELGAVKKVALDGFLDSDEVKNLFQCTVDIEVTGGGHLAPLGSEEEKCYLNFTLHEIEGVDPPSVKKLKQIESNIKEAYKKL